MIGIALLNCRLRSDKPDAAEWLLWHCHWARFHKRHAASVANCKPVDLSSLGIECRNLTSNNSAAIVAECRKAAARHIRAARQVIRAATA